MSLFDGIYRKRYWKQDDRLRFENGTVTLEFLRFTPLLSQSRTHL